jgi:hypothetical protein
MSDDVIEDLSLRSAIACGDVRYVAVSLNHEIGHGAGAVKGVGVIAFSSEVDTGSHKENASKQEAGARL